MNERKLENLHVVIFESRHAKTMADLVRLQGGIPVSAPAMKEVPLENNPDAFLFGEKLFSTSAKGGSASGGKGGIDVLILLTGVGTRTLVSILSTRYTKEDIVAALKKIKIVVRGPKPIRALQELGIPYTLAVPEPNTWREILATLDENKDAVPIKGRVVAVQEYGITNPPLLAGLEERGAKVLRVPVYRWALPDDLEPLKEAIFSIFKGNVHVALFTTAVQIEHLFKVAESMGLSEKLRTEFKHVVVASVGPDCSEAIWAQGISVDIEPKISKMGALIMETAEKASKILTKKTIENARNAIEESEKFISEVRGKSTKFDTRLTLYHDSVFLKACRREKTPYTPVWLMRQAGRYMKDYKKIRDQHSFLEICKNKDLVSEITVTAQEKIGADAAIIFSDILLIVEAFGLGLDYPKGDGPSIRHPIKTAGDIENLSEIEPREVLTYVFQAIRQTRKALKPHIPLIGFAGAPFTLASYMIEGGASKDFEKTKKLMLSDAYLWKALMAKITKATAKYLNEQIRAGVQAVQIFDTWAGCLTAGEYQKHVLPHSNKLIGAIEPGIPVIHFGTGTGAFLEQFASAGGDVIGVDHRVRLDGAWQRIGYQKAIQGNLNPETLLKPIEEIKKEVKTILDEAGGREGHIFNLGHGVLPETPLENVIALVEMVHELSRR